MIVDVEGEFVAYRTSVQMRPNITAKKTTRRVLPVSERFIVRWQETLEVP